MTITEATTTLDLTWQEVDVVEFTGGTLPDMTACVTQIQANLQRGTISATSTPSLSQVLTWLTRAKQELCEAYGFSWARRYAYATLAADSYRFALPPDYGGGSIRMRDMSNDEWMIKTIPLVFDSNYPDVSAFTSDAPGDVVFTIKDRELWTSRPVDADTTVELEYQRTGDDNTATDVRYLPELMRFKICDFGTYKAFLALHQWDAANLWKQEWVMAVNQAMRNDNRKKWSTSNFRCHNWF